MARRLAYTLTEEESEDIQTPRSRQVGARVPCVSLPGEIQNMVGEALASARLAGILQEPVVSQPGRQVL